MVVGVRGIRIAGLIPLALLTACGLTAVERQSIARFAAAAEELGDLCLDELPQMRDTQLELRVAAATPDVVDPEDAASVAAVYYGDFTLERLEVRMKAAQVLKRYGEALGRLVSDASDAELRDASDALVSSLRAHPDLELDDAKLNLIGTAVYTVGWFFVEARRKSSVREIIDQTEADVRTLIMHLAVDLDPMQEGVTSFVDDAIDDVRMQVAVEKPFSDGTEAARWAASDRLLLANAAEQYLAKVATTASTKLTTLSGSLGSVRQALDEDRWYASAFSDENVAALAGLAHDVLSLRDGADPVRENLASARGARGARGEGPWRKEERP